jgi:hypothetical protein
MVPSKCKDELILPVIQDYSGKTGTVEKTEKEDRDLAPEGGSKYGAILVRLDSGQMLKIPRGQKKRGSGLYTPKTGKGAMIEVVYAKDPSAVPTIEQLQQAQQYKDKALEDEFRSLRYHSGPAKGVSVNKQGQLYFSMLSQQRSGRYTAVNPVKGTVYYLGLVRSRPSGLDRELENLLR